MSQSNVFFSVFAKPWRALPLPELGKLVKGLGFDAIELPVRTNFQVTPDAVATDLPRAVEVLADCGVSIASIAGPTDERTIAACAEAGVPIIRICVEGVGSDGYLAMEARTQADFDTKVPLLERYGVTLGVQNHAGACVANAMGLRHLIEKYDPKHIGAVLDPAHNALDGEEPELAIDIVWSHLCMVNLKNAFWQRSNGPEAEVASWSVHWTTGRHGLASWPRVAAELKKRNWKGPVCLTAEYSDHEAVDRLLADDIAFAKSLFA